MNFSPGKKTRQKVANLGCSSSTALTAVALQDHMTRTLDLSLGDPLRTRAQCTRHARNQNRKHVTPVVDTGRAAVRGRKKPAVEAEREFVLDPKPPPPTLAQRLGLVEAPAQRLSEEDWGRVKERSARRQDSSQPCVICKEHFGFQQQVLLSCTHVFHRACLEAFERFTGRKTCPMCRAQEYQTRVIHEGVRLHRHHSATLIQAAWRGHVTRSWYRKLRETVPPRDARLRREFYQHKLSLITDRMIRSLDTDVGGFLRQIDQSIQMSRDIMRQFDDATRRISDAEWQRVLHKAVEREIQDCPICLTRLDGLVPSQPEVLEIATFGKVADSSGVSSGSVTGSQRSRDGAKLSSQVCDQEPETELQSCAFAASNDSGPELSPLEAAKGTRKRSTDGSHMMQNQGNYGDGKKNITPTDGATKRAVVVTSCSHMFHRKCLETLEEFVIASASGVGPETEMTQQRHLCPVCRTNYQKKVLG